VLIKAPKSTESYVKSSIGYNSKVFAIIELLLYIKKSHTAVKCGHTST